MGLYKVFWVLMTFRSYLFSFCR